MPGISEISKELRFGGGLNINTPPWEIADDELTLCTNFFVDKEGVLVKRPGFFEAAVLTNTAPLFIVGYNINYSRWIVAEQGTANVWATVGSSKALISGIPTQIRWGLWVNGTYYVGFGISGNGVRTLTGSGAAPTISGKITNSPDSTVACLHKGRIFTDVVGTPGRLMWSGAGTSFGTWTLTDTIDIDVSNTDPITALCSIGDLLLIFKSNSTWVLYVQGSSAADWVIRRIHETVGCQRSWGAVPAISVGNECYFVSTKGVYKTNGNSLVDIGKKIWLSEQLQYTFQTYSTAIRLTRLDDYLILTGNTNAGYGGYTFVYNLESGAWSTWNFLAGYFDDIVISDLSVHSNGHYLATRGTKTYFADRNTINNYDQYLSIGINTYSDGLSVDASSGAGSTYVSVFNTKDFISQNDGLMRLKWIGLQYLARSPGPTFLGMYDRIIGPTISPGYSSGPFTVSNFDYRMANRSQVYKMSAGRRARVFSLNCNHNVPSPFEFYKASLHLTSKVPILSSGVK